MNISQRLFLLLLIFLAGSSLLPAQQYLWPTDASHYMTSSFCEYRPAHYHSAIDIKTWNREGYPVYAVDDGRLYKVRVSPFGYGKAVYIKLKDGRLAVYGHLQKFNPKIERAIRKLQIKRKRYSVIFTPKHWPLKRGQIIGYSGQTGIGVPHLHFEIRADEAHPLNPLRFYREIKDHIRPRLQSLLVVPQNERARVNHSFMAQTIPLINRGKGQYELARPIYAAGRIGLALRGYDQADGVYNKFSFYRVELFVNRQPRFHIQYDTLNFYLTRQVDVEIYYPFKADSGQVFHKLYIEPYNRLPFYDRRLGNGLIAAGKDTIHFEITASDFFGNTSTVRGVILPAWEPLVETSFIKRLPGFVLLQLLLPSRLQSLAFAFGDGRNDRWRTADYFEILQRRFSSQRQEMLVRLPLSAPQDSILQVTLGRKGFSDYRTLFTLQDAADSAVTLKTQMMAKALLFIVQPARQLPQMRLEIRTGGQTLQPKLFVAPDALQAPLPARALKNDTLQAVLKSGDVALADTTLIVHRFLPGKAKEFSFFNDTLKVGAASAGLYDTLLFTVNKSALDSALRIKYAASGSQYTVRSAAAAFRKSAHLSLSVPRVRVYWRQLGIGKLNGKRRISFIGGHVDSLAGTILARVKRFGSFCVLADTVPPQVSVIQPQAQASLSALKLIRFSAEDTLSGIGTERNLKIEVDGRFVIPEWDPERDIISGRPHWRVAKGEHDVLIEVRDQAGNRTQKRFKIFVAPGREY